MSKADITVELAAALVREQFPQWADLGVTPVELDGWDNTTFRLGDHMSIRLPSGDAYVASVDKEQRWLPELAAFLPLTIPTPVARGVPSGRFNRPWSIYRWIEGDTAMPDRIADVAEMAVTLAGFLTALYSISPEGGPPAGLHNFHRGGPLAVYDDETRQTVARLDHLVDADAVLTVWQRALESRWTRPPVWIHGDVTATNLLVQDGRLSAVIDFGTSAIGDPACDLTMAWTFLDDESRNAFRAGIALDEATWERGRGWALWKALITVDRASGLDEASTVARRLGWSRDPLQVIDEILLEQEAG